MLEPPDLPSETIVSALEANFGIGVATLAFLPIGNDAASWAFRVEAADGRALFLKVRAGPGEPPGAEVPAYLARRGIPLILAPLATTSGRHHIRTNGFALMLTPWIDARVGAEAGLTAEHWRQLGSVMRRIHGAPPARELTGVVRREIFRPTRLEIVEELDALLATNAPGDAPGRALARFVQSRRPVIQSLLERADTLGRQLEGSSSPRVLCHGDLHTWNVLVDRERRLWIVDWDEVTLSPKERDLMFVVGGLRPGLVTEADTAAFLRGYGESTIDPGLLAYYRLAWALQDIGACAEQVYLSPTIGERARRAAMEGLVALFEPGHIVDLALASIMEVPGDGYAAGR